MLKNIKVIGFDADDTLWDNESFFRETEHAFCELMHEYMPEDELNKELFSTEISNLELYGYGVKAFILSLIETSIRVSQGRVSASVISEIINLGKAQLNRPVNLINGVSSVLATLKPHYKLIIVTKGDLLDQERKLKKSNLANFFHHIEIMSDKQEQNYVELLHHLDINPNEFLMVGNSIKSDILPVLKLGGYGVFVPYHTTWMHEYVDDTEINCSRFLKIKTIEELKSLLAH